MGHSRRPLIAGRPCHLEQQVRTTLISLASSALIAISAIAWANVDIGPAIGTKISANFAALDQTGTEMNFGDIAGKNGVVLSFVRSADWCPYCKQQMIDLQTIAGDLNERGFTLATLSYDAPVVLRKFSKQRDISYIMLSDEKSAMIDAFELRDPAYKPESKAYGVPRASIFIISPDGVIRAKLSEESFRDRPQVEAVLDAVDSLTQ
jgi:peroxiredoxin